MGKRRHLRRMGNAGSIDGIMPGSRSGARVIADNMEGIEPTFEGGEGRRFRLSDAASFGGSVIVYPLGDIRGADLEAVFWGNTDPGKGPR